MDAKSTGFFRAAANSQNYLRAAEAGRQTKTPRRTFGRGVLWASGAGATFGLMYLHGSPSSHFARGSRGRAPSMPYRATAPSAPILIRPPANVIVTSRALEGKDHKRHDSADATRASIVNIGHRELLSSILQPAISRGGPLLDAPMRRRAPHLNSGAPQLHGSAPTDLELMAAADGVFRSTGAVQTKRPPSRPDGPLGTIHNIADRRLRR
jgi:hypothetical protein